MPSPSCQKSTVKFEIIIDIYRMRLIRYTYQQ